MAEILNLNRQRKALARAAAEAQAAANRVRHGRSKAGKANDRREEQRRQALLDGARREAETPAATDAQDKAAEPPR